MRRIDVTHTPPTQVDDFAVLKSPGWTVGQVVKRHHHANSAVRNLGSRGCRKPLVHRTTLVRFDMAKSDPPESFDRRDSRNGFGDETEHRPRASVEEQWFFRVD
jgi:hypothetical protein